MNIDTEKKRFVIRANIVKYEKLLATYLTPDERTYVEGRLKEENSALTQFARDGNRVTSLT
jgi:hypothetical protein